MDRIALAYEDGTSMGTWFNRDRARYYPEAEDWNGSNFISRATGSQWDSEGLYRTASGAWILHTSSRESGVLERFTPIDVSVAYSWLIANDHAEAIPAKAVEAREIGSQRLEALGFRRIPRIRSTYWKLLGGTELCVVRPGHGEKNCDFDRDQVPYDAEELIAWGDEMAIAIASNRDYSWRRPQ